MAWEFCANLLGRYFPSFDTWHGNYWSNLTRILVLQENTSAIFPPRRKLFWMVFTSAVGKVWEAQNKAWRRVWAAHASQAGGCSACLRRVRMNHEKPWKGAWVLHDSQEWGGKGFEAVQCAPQLPLVEVGKRYLPYDMGLPRSELAGAEELKMK